jgi:hypothetical protein
MALTCRPVGHYIGAMQEQVDLWHSDGCAAWHSALSRYEDVVRAQGVSGLPELDAWYRSELPASIASRHPAYITLDELVQVTRWKMKRGVWRQRNLLLVEGNPAPLVEDVSRQAFAAVPDHRKPIVLLSELSGVGAATASAVMAAHTPAVYPFFDELVAAQVPGLGPVAFTAAYYARYAESLRQRTSTLSETCPHDKWTVQGVSQALWSASGGKIGSTPRRQDAEDAPSL